MPKRFLLALLLAAPWATAAVDTVEREVNYLLEFVAASGCTFIRNGAAHDSEEAADHLRMKYERGRRFATTADDFIDRLATESSWSGKPYTVHCHDSQQASGEWLHRALEAHRQQQTSAP